MQLDIPIPVNADAGIARDIYARPLANTHDHLFPETMRLAMTDKLDWTICMDGYAAGVLNRAGISAAEMAQIPGPMTPEEKWDMLAPYWLPGRMTGVLRPQILAAQRLYGVDDINRGTVGEITRQIRAGNRPGVQRRILKDVAHFDHVQIVSNVHPLYPQDIDSGDGFLFYDLDLSRILSGKALPDLEKRTGRKIGNFTDYVAAADWCFTQYGPRAVGAKIVNNYWRALDFRPRRREEAESAFAKCVLGGEPVDTRALEDFMFYHAAARALEYDLPLRFHCGFTAGITPMPAIHPANLEPVIAACPRNRFVLLHAGYPFIDETVALCQAYPHVYADLGWIWQIDPVWSEQFVRRFVTGAGPWQLLLFGGDTGFAETSFAYSLAARQGLAVAVTRLLRDGFIDAADVPVLLDRVMTGNARRCFPRIGSAPANAAPRPTP